MCVYLLPLVLIHFFCYQLEEFNYTPILLMISLNNLSYLTLLSKLKL